MRGQVYDRASNMSGKTHSAAVRISSRYPLVLYAHCTSHCLNLVVVASFEEVRGCNMVGVVKRPSSFFFCLPQASEGVGRSYTESNVVKLKDLCRTRWIERINVLDCIKKVYSSIVACFVSISPEGSRVWCPDSVTDASTPLLVITRIESMCSCDYQWVSTVSQGPHNKPSRGG